MFWHLLNFFAAPTGLGLIAASLAKLLWLGGLKGVAWRRLAGWAMLASAAVSVGGLLVFGHDGKMATYAVMVLACGLTLWWVGFGPRKR